MVNSLHWLNCYYQRHTMVNGGHCHKTMFLRTLGECNHYQWKWSCTPGEHLHHAGYWDHRSLPLPLSHTLLRYRGRKVKKPTRSRVSHNTSGEHRMLQKLRKVITQMWVFCSGILKKIGSLSLYNREILSYRVSVNKAAVWTLSIPCWHREYFIQPASGKFLVKTHVFLLEYLHFDFCFAYLILFPVFLFVCFVVVNSKVRYASVLVFHCFI